MVEKIEVEIKGQKYIIKEITVDEDNIEYVEGKDKKQLAKEILLQQLEYPKLTLEDIGKLPNNIFNILISEINKLNTFDVKYFTNSQN